jgi:glucose-1-phosphate thymidylyltransferase
MTKGIVLAGGKGTRLYPLTHCISKQLLPVYNKPMIYYPLQTLKSMGITEILIITADPQQCRLFEDQLKDGSQYGLQLTYKVQDSPRGLPDAFIVGGGFSGADLIDDLSTHTVDISTIPTSKAYSQALDILKSLQLH